jgi:hypothetical protein
MRAVQRTRSAMVRASMVSLFFLPALMAFIFAGCAISNCAL